MRLLSKGIEALKARLIEVEKKASVYRLQRNEYQNALDDIKAQEVVKTAEFKTKG